MPSPELRSTGVDASDSSTFPLSTASSCSNSIVSRIDLEDSIPATEHARPNRCRVVIIAVSLVALACVSAVILKSDILSVGTLTPDDYNGNIPPDERNNADAAEQMRIHSFCGVTDFKDLCVSDISASSSSSPNSESGAGAGNFIGEMITKAMILASIQSAMDGIRNTLNYSHSGEVESHLKPGIADCDELLNLSLIELIDARADVLASDVSELLPVMAADLRDALSAAIAYEHSCSASINSIASATATSALSTAELLHLLGNATISTRNTLAIISTFTEPVQGFYTLPLQPVMDANPTTPPEGKILMEGPEIEEKGMVRGDASIWFPPEIERHPDVVVAKDNSGDCHSITEALKLAVDKKRKGRFIVYVKKGVYEETVHVTSEMTRVTMYGDGPANTIVTGNRSAATGFTLYNSATFAVTGKAFMARGMRFENRGGGLAAAAVALRVESDLSVFHDVHVESYHTPLHAHAHRQFFRDCVVVGSADLIAGDASAALQQCRIEVNAAPEGLSAVITASMRVDRHQSTAISLQNCNIAAAKGKNMGPALLGRVSGGSARAVVMKSKVGKVVAAAGWEVEESGVGGGAGTEVFFGEYGNRGPGAVMQGRVRWEGYHVMSAWEARKFSAGEFIQAAWWLNATGVPFDHAFF